MNFLIDLLKGIFLGIIVLLIILGGVWLIRPDIIENNPIIASIIGKEKNNEQVANEELAKNFNNSSSEINPEQSPNQNTTKQNLNAPDSNSSSLDTDENSSVASSNTQSSFSNSEKINTPTNDLNSSSSSINQNKNPSQNPTVSFETNNSNSIQSDNSEIEDTNLNSTTTTDSVENDPKNRYLKGVIDNLYPVEAQISEENGQIQGQFQNLTTTFRFSLSGTINDGQWNIQTYTPSGQLVGGLNLRPTELSGKLNFTGEFEQVVEGNQFTLPISLEEIESPELFKTNIENLNPVRIEPLRQVQKGEGFTIDNLSPQITNLTNSEAQAKINTDLATLDQTAQTLTVFKNLSVENNNAVQSQKTSYKISFNRDNFLSFIFTRTTIIANEDQIREEIFAKNYSLETGELVKIDTLFKSNQDYLEELWTEVENRAILLDPRVKNALNEVEPRKEIFENFSLTDNGLQINLIIAGISDRWLTIETQIPTNSLSTLDINMNAVKALEN